MTSRIITPAEFTTLIRPLLALPVSLAWPGYGSAVFFELGALTEPEGRRRLPSGEANIGIEWDWRVELGERVCFGSSNTRPEIAEGLSRLQGATLIDIAISGRIPELALHFASGYCLRSMVMVSGNPEWRIRLPDQNWLWARRGLLYCGTGESEPVSVEEEAALARADQTALRWGRLEHVNDACCRKCMAFVRLNGDGALLDFGCCTQPGGPHDGSAVHLWNTCPKFTPSDQ
ncbi:hypothetical protein SAMN02745857_01885 [Andreprevotia lacus DSM 23236]|jgi:hypothetical protein|uniref:Uncharacterized protein n=1 Tax=Andreprevotia lacus DSM 23236 TaxID=1121001 RepID=A0A1W1XLJ0_9NEIS|nr:hypothetical protein [Andreprevotia lacus]SMC24378.1 hypothetical protein SAMN02745857_01885 [Andreprevotia lacus DSM 23236]